LQNIAVIHNHDESFNSNRKGFSRVAVVVTDVHSEGRFVVVDIVDVVEELFVRVRQQQVLRLLRLRGIPRLRSDPSHAHAT
jgi:hypothetical protein